MYLIIQSVCFHLLNPTDKNMTSPAGIHPDRRRAPFTEMVAGNANENISKRHNKISITTHQPIPQNEPIPELTYATSK